MQINRKDHFKLFSDMFLKTSTTVAHGKHTDINMIGNNVEILEIYNINENVLKGLKKDFGEVRRIEFSYYGVKPHKTRMPPARLAFLFEDDLIVLQVHSEQTPGTANVKFNIVSYLDPENSFKLDSNHISQISFCEILVDMIRFEKHGTKKSSMPVKTEVITVEDVAPEPFLENLPPCQGGWLPRSHLVPFVSAVHRSITEDPSAWLQQGLELNCRTKYINVRIDQRTGDFIVTGDMSPKLMINHSYPDHFYPNGWANCKLHPGILQMVFDINKCLKQTQDLEKAPNDTVRVQVATVIDSLTQIAATNNIHIETKKIITGQQLMKYYGKKP